MLAPTDRSLFTDQLRPPSGYELMRAIGTSFTLDLTTALGVPLAFGAAAMSESRDPIAILDGVRRFADRVDIFAQAGEVFVPPASDLVALLEPMIHPVALTRGRLFHPKVWVLEFGRDDERAYRLLCSSRNLTSDRTWDTILRLDSSPTGAQADNAPLQEFVGRLPDLAVVPVNPERRQAIAALVEALGDVRWELPEGVRRVGFHPFGLGRQPDPALFDAYRTVVISPFLSDEGIDHVVARRAGTAVVVSRPESLDRLKPATLARLTKLYVLDAGTNEDEEANQLVGLHAKAVVVDRKRGTSWFVGSANATGAGFGGNVEFMVELETKGDEASRLIDPRHPLVNLLLPYETDGGVEDDQGQKDDNALDRAVRLVAAGSFVVEGVWDGTAFATTIASERADVASAGFSVTVRLITQPGRAIPLPSTGEFASLGSVALEDLSPFLVVDVMDHRSMVRSAVVMAELRGDRPERRQAILARQVNSPEKFMQLLALLLSFGSADMFFTAGSSGGHAEGPAAWAEFSTGIFERLARALTDAPHALDDLASLIEGIKVRDDADSVIPEGFAALWADVLEARAATS